MSKASSLEALKRHSRAVHLMVTALSGKTHDHLRDDHHAAPVSDVRTNAGLHFFAHTEIEAKEPTEGE